MDEVAAASLKQLGPVVPTLCVEEPGGHHCPPVSDRCFVLSGDTVIFPGTASLKEFEISALGRC